MRSLDTTRRPATDLAGPLATGPAGPPATAPAWSDADLVALTLRFAIDPTPPPAPARAPATAGPLTGRVTDRVEGVLRSSTAPATTPAATPTDRPWSVQLLVTADVQAWLLGWPAGLVTAAHGHGRTAVAVTVVEGGLSEDCLDPTIWTTSRRTTWRAGASTLFPAGHVHVLGAVGNRPAVAVLAWSRPAGSAGGGAGRLLGAAATGRGRGGGGGRAEPVGVGPGRGRHHCLAGEPAHGALDLGHVRDRVAG